MDELLSIGAAQRERIKYVDYHAYFFGRIVRKDLQEKFGIAEAAATRDLSEYNKLAPQNLIYQPSIRSYVISSEFTPLFKHSVESVLSDSSIDSVLSEKQFRLGTLPTTDIVAAFSQGIHLQKVIECNYYSASSGKKTRHLVPHSIFDTGLHWYVRAYDKSRDRFSDFALTRMLKATLLNEPPVDSELQEHDAAFNDIVTLIITAHPKQEQSEAIEFDYGMKNGQIKLETRASLAGYLLRRWNVDCSISGEGKEHQLRLANAKELKELGHLRFAPGFSLG